jgi:hypothetical protein
VERKHPNQQIKNSKMEITTNTMEIQGISETTLRTYIPMNQKIVKKLTNF